MNNNESNNSNILILKSIRKRLKPEKILSFILAPLLSVIVLTVIMVTMVFINHHNLSDIIVEGIDDLPEAPVSGVTLYERGNSFIMDKTFWDELAKLHVMNSNTVRIPLYYDAYTQKTDPYAIDQSWIAQFVNIVQQFHSGGFHVIVSVQPVGIDDMAEITRYHSVCIQVHRALSFYRGDELWFEIGLPTAGDLAPLWDTACFQVTEEISKDGKCPVIIAFPDGIDEAGLDMLTWQLEPSAFMLATPYRSQVDWPVLGQWMSDHEKKLLIYQEDMADGMDFSTRQQITDTANEYGFGKLLDGINRSIGGA